MAIRTNVLGRIDSCPSFHSLLAVSWPAACLVLALTPLSEAVTLRTETVITTGLSRPIAGVGLPDQPTQFLIVEQLDQDIRLLDTSTNQVTDFLNLPNAATNAGERGLKGIALHPDYANNGKLYVHQYEPVSQTISILEFTRSASNPLIADP